VNAFWLGLIAFAIIIAGIVLVACRTADDYLNLDRDR